MQLGSSYERPKRNPLWLLVLRWFLMTIVSCLIYGVGLHAMQQAHWPLWQSFLMISGGLMIYIGLSFFVRPNANYQNLGALGGLVNDPLQYSDNINRKLVELEFVLLPGLYVAETLLDTAHFLGLLSEDTDE